MEYVAIFLEFIANNPASYAGRSCSVSSELRFEDFGVVQNLFLL